MSPLRPLIAAAALACLLLTASAGPATAAATARAASSLLFVQQTDGGSLQRTGASTFRLTLRGVAPSVATFADRPARSAASEPAKRFIARWAGRGFADDPPNAALVMDGAPAGRDVAMLTLSHPRYHPATRTFTYVARALTGDPGTALKVFHARRDPVRELRFGAASLFIDDAAALVAQQITLLFDSTDPDDVYALQLTPTPAPYGGDVAFVPGSASDPAISLAAPTGDGPITTATISANRISFTVSAKDLAPGTSFLYVNVSFVADPSLLSFSLRNVSSPASVGVSYLQPAAELSPPTPILRTDTLIPWPVVSGP
jgi:hypothetical protein